MQKSKKLSKSKKSVIVFIYGPIAVGKLTVAKILSKKLGYKLSHNHALNDLIDEIFEYGTPASGIMKEALRPQLLEGMARAGINTVVTHTYSHDYVSPTGLADPKYMKILEGKVTKAGAIFCPVHLKAEHEELMRRVGMISRKEFKKLTNKKIMRQHLVKKDWQTSPKLKNNLIIDNTQLSPARVAEIIIRHFKLS